MVKKGLFVGGVVIAAGVAVWLGFRQEASSPIEKAEVREEEGVDASVSFGGAGEVSSSEARGPELGGSYVEENLSGAVKTLLGLSGDEQNYNSLEAAIHLLSRDLSPDDVAALRELLTWPNDRFPEKMRAIEINAVKNDVLDRLLRQNELPEGIGLQMVEMASDSGNDPVWRDYCVQFMQPFYERLAAECTVGTENGEGTSAQSADELAAVREAMVSALAERDSTIAGTSLIGLELLSRTHGEFDRGAITDSALEIAADDSASASCRLTAMRLSAGLAAKDHESQNSELEPDAVAETARILAQTGETALLRSAAIVTLGETGAEEDRELLESFALSDNKQIVAAAELALQKMTARD